MTTYLPVAEEFDACPNHQCTCAVQGRVHTTLANNGVGFGIHSIQCTQHPYGDISVKEMEDKLQAKYGDFSKYDAFMDDNMAFWANNLDNYAHAFQVKQALKIAFMYLFGSILTNFSISEGRYSIYDLKMDLGEQSVLQFIGQSMWIYSN